MTARDEFDDPEGFESAFGKIAEAMEQSRNGVRRRGPMIGVATLLVALFVLFAVFWSTYPRGDRREAGAGPVPIVRADATPYKIAPDNPGGMDIPYRDSTVFETLRNANIDEETESKVESLLPPPEEPIDRTQMFAGLKTEPIDSGVDEEKDFGPVATSPAPDEALDEPVTVAASASLVPVPKPQPKPDFAKAEKEAVRAEPAAGDVTAGVKDVPAATGAYFIQLGSVKDRAAAESEWRRLQKEFPAQLGTLTLRVQEANLGERGTFYRIQGGAVEQGSAKTICNAIAARRAGGCLVVSR